MSMTIHGVGFSSDCLLILLLLQSFQIGENVCEFRCGDGSCISTSEICNGQKDCADGSDETREVCSVLPCRNALGVEDFVADQSFGLGDVDLSFVSTYRCEYGGCISINFKCNGIFNCADNSDETAEVCKDMNCNANQFRCDYGACISLQDVCNNAINCHDGSDERPENCKFRISPRRIVCPKRNKRYCDNRRECYDLREECDGKFDCLDKSDEKAELCHRPPTTTPTTAPETSPPVVFPDPGGPSLNEVDCPPPNCRCPMPRLEHFCLPCEEIADLNATCLSLDNDAVCSLKKVADVSIEVLSCGAQSLITTAAFSRGARPCADQSGMVPSMTLVYADCWGVSSQIMRCHSDGYWRVYGAQMSGRNDFDSYDSFTEQQPMKHLCQPYFVNSQVCGRRPRYNNTGGTHQLGGLPENRWPMVMGLKKKERYACSATLISPLFVLTAAHCVIVSQESRNQTMDEWDLKVQISPSHDVRVFDIILHPDYEPGRNPRNDLALIWLKKQISFNRNLYPACVDLDGSAFLHTYRALTFSRPYGANRFSYEQIRQQIDTGCFDRINSCAELQITNTQFCGVDQESNSSLVRGSSGGPFLQNLGSDDSEEWTVSGVVSFSHQQHTCPHQRTVFTATNAFRSWITDFVHNEI